MIATRHEPQGDVSAQLRRKLTVEDVQERSGRWRAFRTPSGRWPSSGCGSPPVCCLGAKGALRVRAVEVWVKTREAVLTERVTGELRNRLDELERELRQPRPLEVVRS